MKKKSRQEFISVASWTEECPQAVADDFLYTCEFLACQICVR